MHDNSKTKAMLCELIIVTLFLALSSVTILGLFVSANSMSRESQVSTYSTMLAQDALECLLAGEAVPQMEPRVYDGNEYSVIVDTTEESTDAGMLNTYRVQVEFEKETVTKLETTAYVPKEASE